MMSERPDDSISNPAARLRTEVATISGYCHWQSTWPSFDQIECKGHATAEMSENNINLSNDGSSYNTVWEDTVCGTGRFEARLGHIGQEYRDTGIQGWRRRLYCHCQVGVDLGDKLGGNSSVKSLARRVVEPRVLDKGSSRLCDDLPKNGPELDA
jgi:hypothetical protein